MSAVHTVMAVYPNTIGFGYAVVSGEVLKPIDAGVVRITPVSNVECIDRITQLIERHGVSVLVVQGLSGKHSRKADRTEELLEGINLLAVTRGIRVYKYSREQVRFVFSHFKARSKQEIAEQIVEAMPQYRFRLPSKRRPWQAEHYNMGMFDALSLVLTYDWMDG